MKVETFVEELGHMMPGQVRIEVASSDGVADSHRTVFEGACGFDGLQDDVLADEILGFTVNQVFAEDGVTVLFVCMGGAKCPHCGSDLAEVGVVELKGFVAYPGGDGRLGIRAERSQLDDVEGYRCGNCSGALVWIDEDDSTVFVGMGEESD